jgi:arylformamidase
MQMQMHPMHPMMQMQMMQMMQNQARMGNMGNMGMGGPMVKGLGKNRMLPGDWVCTACRFHNFANKTQCRTCQLPKSSSVPVSSMQENMGNPRAPVAQSPRGGARSIADTREVGHADAPAPFSLDTAEVLSRVLSDPNREIIDVSWPITESSTSWQDKSPVALDAVQDWDADSCRSSTVRNLTYHTGTHITAPAHIDKDGAPIEHEDWGMCGECVVLDLTEVRRKHGITADDLKPFEAQLKPQIIVLLKTSNSSSDADAVFRADFVGLAESGAAYLVGRKVKGVGCDYLSIERKDVEPASTYKTLLGGGVAVIEGLRLAGVKTVDLEEEVIGAREGNYTLACLFLRLNGVEAAPARAVLLPSGR